MARSVRLLTGIIILLSGRALYAAEESEPALIDPTRPVAFVAPAGKVKKAEDQLQLQAIYSGGGRQQAVINGHLVNVGDKVGQAVIVAINPAGVRYKRNNEEGELVLLPKVSKPARGGD